MTPEEDTKGKRWGLQEAEEAPLYSLIEVFLPSQWRAIPMQLTFAVKGVNVGDDIFIISSSRECRFIKSKTERESKKES